jgi:hypothetical protein
MPPTSSGRNSDITPILRTVFPELPEEVLKEIHEGFVTLFGMLHDEYQKEHTHAANALPLDES